MCPCVGEKEKKTNDRVVRVITDVQMQWNFDKSGDNVVVATQCKDVVDRFLSQ